MRNNHLKRVALQAVKVLALQRMALPLAIAVSSFVEALLRKGASSRRRQLKR